MFKKLKWIQNIQDYKAFPNKLTQNRILFSNAIVVYIEDNAVNFKFPFIINEILNNYLTFKKLSVENS